ncbi:DNA polymerase III subunit gamma and tau, partial [Kocuria tytonicola]|uniref:DNA polymerase III subunit gamma and tau n=1 Tax=Kocuria tytonicola TaxID=2055946 RepID=UPI000EF8C9D6
MTTALYRRYRPETFEDVIGQEHVTEPLMTALRKNRVNHAYLFSGPRGCGKTTSARILARCLNCAEGPTATPCGQCESCRDLARNGAGSLDVIEMDAASHGGVDHARDLRERATFAPVRDRYKIFIIDEAHMVTREGFNALLKIVEEPPEHVKFIFATTEPSKVLTTIRSRTHHYPFRLVPPEPLMRYLEQLCQEEGVTTEPGVLSLVVRAGGGSVRDSLSVLDQLMAGSDERGLTYDLAVALLGYTHAALLDDVVDAFAAGDAATVFSSVDRVVQTGQDPRRFVEDLLERFRDLVVVNAVPDSAANILHGMPTDQINRLRNQATQLGAAELSRSADITNEALNEMTGATSPQLHLELLCARILLPSADHTTRGITSRVDRLERRLSIPRGAGIRQSAQDGTVSAPGAEPTPPPSSGASEPVHDAAPARTPSSSGGAAGPETSSAPRASSSPRPAAPGRTAEPVGGNGPVDESGEETVDTGPAPSRPVRQDGSEPGRPAFETPDVAEPSDPQDESEEPQGSEYPAAA